MTKTKRILSLVLTLIMVLGTFNFVFAESGSGNPKIDKLVELGLVQGTETGDLKLNATITRAEMATMIARILGQETLSEQMKGVGSGFKDVPVSHWANGYINVARGKGIITGYPDGTFGPEKSVTYEEAVSMLIRSVKPYTAEEIQNAKWPMTYILDASQAGILKDVVLADYKVAATREKIFEMIYNMVEVSTLLNVGDTFEGIVTENARTEGLKSDEFKLVLTRGIKKDNKVVHSEFDELTFVLNEEVKAKGWDTEKLLGKAVKVIFNKEGKLISIELLEGYKYETGILEEITDNSIKVNGTKYTIGKYDTDKYTVDNFLFTAYFNNDAYEFKNTKSSSDFMRKVNGNTIDEYVRLTIKSGKVLFVEAMAFGDIAPVAEDITSKGIVSFRNDNIGGDSTNLRVEEKEVIVLELKDGELVKGSVEKIKANSVIHWFKELKGELTIVVKPASEATVVGEFKEVSSSKASGVSKVELTLVSKEDKSIDFTANVNKRTRNAVYSVNGTDFYTLSNNFVRELSPFSKKEVTVLTDIFGEVQVISAEVGTGTVYGVITDILGYEFRIVTQNSESQWVKLTNRTELKGVSGSTMESKYKGFQNGDLVKVSVVDNELVEMERVTSSPRVLNKVTKDIVEFSADEYYYLDGKTLVFDLTGAKPALVRLADFEKVFDTAKEMKGFVVTNAKSTRTVEVLVVTNATVKENVNVTTKIVEFTRIRYNGDKVFIDVVDADGDYTSHLVLKGKGLDAINNNLVNKGSVVELTVTKDDAKDVVDIVELIDEANHPIFRVVEARRDLVTLADVVGETRTLRVISTTAEFGYFGTGDYVSFASNDAYSTLKAIKVVKATRPTGYFTPVAPENPAEHSAVVTFVNKTVGSESIEVEYLDKTVVEYKLTGLARALVNKVNVGDFVRPVVENGVLTDVTVVKSPVVNQAKANEVKALITALDKTLPTFETKVGEARVAYDKLNADQKALVTNYKDLQDAETGLELASVTAKVNALFVDVTAETLELAEGVDKAKVNEVKTLVEKLKDGAEKVALNELITLAEGLLIQD